MLFDGGILVAQC